MPADQAQIAVNVGADGVTVYLTRSALEELAVELNRLIASDPAECAEVHLTMHFSNWVGDVLTAPSINFSDELRPVLVDARRTALDRAIAAGDIDADATLSPFEVTLMHVSAEAVLEETARADVGGDT